MKPKILSTKKLDPSLLNEAAQKNIEICEQEFISIQECEQLDLNQQLAGLNTDHVIFTSAHAVMITDSLVSKAATENWKIFCLSGKTLKAVEAAGNIGGTILETAAHAEELAGKIIRAGVKKVIFFCGLSRRNELPDRLKNAGIDLKEIVFYKTVETAVINNDPFDGILFFSPSAVHSYFSCNELKKHTICFAIGSTTAASIHPFTPNPVYTAEKPDQASILELVAAYFSNHKLKQ